jgi:hypothetical protein
LHTIKIQHDTESGTDPLPCVDQLLAIGLRMILILQRDRSNLTLRVIVLKLITSVET